MRAALVGLLLMSPLSLWAQPSGFSGSLSLGGLVETGRPLVPYQSSRGANGTIEADLRFDSKWLQIRVNPRIWKVQNLLIERFPVEDLNSTQFQEYRNEYRRIDLPEVFGGSGDLRTHWGRSRVAIGHPKARVGVSTESRAWGAGQRQQLLFSDHSLGFWHGYAELDRIPIGLGTLGMTVIAGRLDSSGYARFPMPKEWRVLSGVNVNASPSFVPGLTVGLIRMFVQNGSQVRSVGDWFPFLQPFEKSALGAGTDGSGSQPDNQLASVYFRWSFVESAVELYGEYARDDHSLDFRDAFLEPDHMRAYLLGFRKKIRLNHEYGVEIVNLIQSNPRHLRDSASWYSHGSVRHGHTHLGQVLGAEIGPGSRSQEVWWESQRSRVSVRRVDVDKDLYHAAFTGAGYRPEVDWILKAGRDWTTERWTWSLDASWRHTRNRFYIQGRHESSFGLGFGARYSLD